MEYLEQHRLFELRHEMGLCIVILDIDHFKRVNDTLGHPVGDVVLKDLASVSQGCLRDSDLLARYGGEEFIAVLPKTAIDDAVAVAERLRTGIEYVITSYSIHYTKLYEPPFGTPEKLRTLDSHRV